MLVGGLIGLIGWEANNGVDIGAVLGNVVEEDWLWLKNISIMLFVVIRID